MESGFVYTHLPSGVHRMVFQDVQAQTLSDWAKRLKEIMDSTPPRETIRLLIYVSAVPSMQLLISHIRSIKEEHPERRASRVCVVYESLQLSLLNIMTRALVRASTLRLFPKKDEADALQWIVK